MAIKTSRKATKKATYAPVLKLPKLSYEEFTALHDSIAVNGVLVPIIVDSDGPKRKIIDGNYRKQIAEELGYDCPEIIQPDLNEEDKRTLARCLNLTRRQLTPEQKRGLVADQLEETPERSNRVIAKGLGVHHATVAAVRAELEASGNLIQMKKTVGEDGRIRSVFKKSKPHNLTRAELNQRITGTTLIHGDCRKEFKKIPTASIDCIITDPPYPEVRPRGSEYPRISEQDWHEMMHAIVVECRRVLKPHGSAIFVLQSNAKRIGEMRLWLWEFMVWAGKEWNLVEDVYWWDFTALPTRGAKRHIGLLRPSVKACVWLGSPNCYRSQDNILWSPSDSMAAKRRSDMALRESPSGRNWRNDTLSKAVDERGGTTPFNLIPLSTGNQQGSGGHPAVTPYNLAQWWCRYILPQDGVLLDPFCGSGTMLLAGLDCGASKVIGIEKEAKYFEDGEEEDWGGWGFNLKNRVVSQK